MVTLSRIYAGGLAVISAIWWAVLLLAPATRAPFLWAGVPDSVLLTFVPADMIFVIALPALYAWKGKPELWLLFCGAFGYAAILTFAFCIQYQSGWLGAGLMGLGLMLNIALSLGLRKP